MGFSKDCLDALAVTGKTTAGVQRALADQSIFQAAVLGTSIPWTMLAALAIRESNVENGSEKDGAGVGVGVFQISVPANATYAQAANLTWAANDAANMLNNNMTYLASQFNFTPAQLLQATAASYNLGPGGISGNPNTIDNGTPGSNFGSNVVAMMSCFQ